MQWNIMDIWQGSQFSSLINFDESGKTSETRDIFPVCVPQEQFQDLASGKQMKVCKVVSRDHIEKQSFTDREVVHSLHEHRLASSIVIVRKHFQS